MTKNLSEMDKAYDSVFEQLTVTEKVRYCINLIERTHTYVVKNNEKLTDHIKKQSKELINAAQKEIMQLSKQKMTNGSRMENKFRRDI